MLPAGPGRSLDSLPSLEMTSIGGEEAAPSEYTSCRPKGRRCATRSGDISTGSAVPDGFSRAYEVSRLRVASLDTTKGRTGKRHSPPKIRRVDRSLVFGRDGVERPPRGRRSRALAAGPGRSLDSLRTPGVLGRVRSQRSLEMTSIGGERSSPFRIHVMSTEGPPSCGPERRHLHGIGGPRRFQRGL